MLKWIKSLFTKQEPRTRYTACSDCAGKGVRNTWSRRPDGVIVCTQCGRQCGYWNEAGKKLFSLTVYHA